jgi:DNA-binding NarL/FixJ family response regulator
MSMEATAAAKMAKVLLIDDEPIVRKVVRVVLEAEGHEVLEASDGSGGLDGVRDHDPDAIVLVNTAGRGMDDYEELLSNEAVGGLDAVADDEILLIDSTKATATAGLHTVDGMEEVARWLHPDRFGEG